MAVVHLQADHRRFTNGQNVITVEGNTVGALIDELEHRYPGLGHLLTDGASVAINGELIPNGIFERVEASTEVHFIAPIAGG
ncbi:MAG: MoaD/ThiS family protein [Acidimicrobiia bacterium]|nr:MoaD/ThiS family protein [Acidimicrobiia bacterium]MCY4458238.1 MoaD/ThiS family protein [Acidimicrobiaceae bacterium]